MSGAHKRAVKSKKNAKKNLTLSVHSASCRKNNDLPQKVNYTHKSLI